MKVSLNHICLHYSPKFFYEGLFRFGFYFIDDGLSNLRDEVTLKFLRYISASLYFFREYGKENINIPPQKMFLECR